MSAVAASHRPFASRWLALMTFAAICGIATCGVAFADELKDWKKLRDDMVDLDLAPCGIRNPKVLAAMRQTMRHKFVPANQRAMAYFDMALPIGEDQTISPPFIVALMTQNLNPQPTDRVLEIGTGSGYQAAVLANLVREVYSIEIDRALGERAAATLEQLGYANVTTRIGDGYQGWPEKAPFDKIIVTCSPEKAPQPLVDQLREGGLMVIPLGEQFQQTLYLMRKRGGKLTPESSEPTFFVPMTGAAEDERGIQTDGRRPQIVNGDFEQSLSQGDLPANWFYVRQSRLETTPDRGHVLRFSNTTRGRNSQALQAVGIDGQQVASIDVSLRVRGRHLREGVAKEQQPRLLVTFFDHNKQPAGQGAVGPWSGDLGWSQKSATLLTPPDTAFAVIAVGLLGGTGELWVDDVTIKVHETRGKLAGRNG